METLYVPLKSNAHGHLSIARDESSGSPVCFIQKWAHPKFGQVMDLRGPRYGARFDPNGDFIGFL